MQRSVGAWSLTILRCDRFPSLHETTVGFIRYGTNIVAQHIASAEVSARVSLTSRVSPSLPPPRCIVVGGSDVFEPRNTTRQLWRHLTIIMGSVSEAEVLTAYLGSSTSLPSFLTSQQFLLLFPAKDRVRHLEDIKSLYRDLQRQQCLLAQRISENIERELRNARSMRKGIAASKRTLPDLNQSGISDAASFAQELFSGKIDHSLSTGMTAGDGYQHTLESLNDAMEEAEKDLLSDLTDEQYYCQHLLDDIRVIVSGLSDLRYGRMIQPSTTEVRDEVANGILDLRATCEHPGVR